ncbi:porin [Burkholderia pseudomultivorans]|uniref:porin n=1 Tax=Burkholderia pseudomultivorans TaxID=1207504 RepID=UPI00075C1310|nr:porin [Burkholderia pseudomultivorans]KWE99428.1 porin [Burkholderia pseudomultivorans]
MNRLILGAAVAAMGTCNVYAQSSITLYGQVTAGLDFVNHVATGNGGSSHVFRFGSDQYHFSWFGLTGSEDLGGGMQAVFKLESLFSTGTGQNFPDQLFTRYAYVGLASSTYGSIWLGRAMSLTDTTGWYLDPFGEQSIGDASLANGRAWGPRSNQITYNSPTWGGFSFRLQNGFGNSSASFQAGRTFSASFDYAAGNLAAHGVYEEIRDANGKFSDLYTASREYMIGGTYQLGAVRFYVGYQLLTSNADTIATAYNPYKATRSQQEWFGASYQVNPALTFGAAWYHANINHGGGNGNLGVLGTTYSLSKRTTLYATFGAMFNGKHSVFSVETQDSPPNPGQNQLGGYFGVIHYF